MKRTLLPSSLLILLASPAFAADTPPEFRPLFDGRTLDGWWGCGTENPRQWKALAPDALAKKKADSLADIEQHWSVVDGELVNDGHGLYLTTDQDFGDFELRLEYRTVAGADSGIYLRGCPQVQIWDTTEAGGKWGIGADKGSGGIWNNSPGAKGKDPSVHADRPFGEWNAFRVTMIGERVTVDLNGERVVDDARMENYFDRKQPVPARGPIQLQTHGGEIRWRNVIIREIGAGEANAWLADRDADGFRSIFNGQDLSGWRGAVDDYQVVDGALMCQPGHGGNLFTEEEYADFSVEMEISLPPGGNNGLAIRFPGQGNPAYDGMCELQVLENTHEKYANLDARQYHGSVYGQVPAHRGYQRAPGEWNFQRVTVRGSHITVELNGTRIVDADITAATDLMGGTEKFLGRTRTSGHFGFAGHNDPVRFRAVRAKKLD